MAPSQLSVAVRSTGGGKSAAHAKFKSIGGAGGTGANSSSIISKVKVHIWLSSPRSNALLLFKSSNISIVLVTVCPPRAQKLIFCTSSELLTIIFPQGKSPICIL